MDNYSWYSQLKKPFFAPPSWLFGPVWTVLYVIIFATFGYVFYKISKKELPKTLAYPFIINLISNFLFTPIQFGLKSNFLAALDISIVLFSLLWAMKSIYKYNKAVALAQIPYLAWVSFATVLQFSITWLNL